MFIINLKPMFYNTRKKLIPYKSEQCNLKPTSNNLRLISMLMVSILGLTVGFITVLDPTCWQGNPNKQIAPSLGSNPFLVQYDSVFNKLTGKIDQALKPAASSRKKKKKAALDRTLKPLSKSGETIKYRGSEAGKTLIDPEYESLKQEYEALNPEHETLKPLIRHLVLLPDDELLLILRSPPQTDGAQSSPFDLPAKENLACLYHRLNNTTTKISALDYISRGHIIDAMIRCRTPREYSSPGHDGVDYSSLASVSVIDLSAQREVPSDGSAPSSEYSTEFVPLTTSMGRPVSRVKEWSSLVFEIWHTDEDVVLFAKGVNGKQGKNVDPSELACVYGSTSPAASGKMHGTSTVTTQVTHSVQEVFRCKHPKEEFRKSLYGAPLTIQWGDKVLDTVVDYFPTSHDHRASLAEHIQSRDGQEIPDINHDVPNSGPESEDSSTVKDQPDPTQRDSTTSIHAGGSTHASTICACTMVYNVAKFVREWGIYHAHLGIDEFIFYDNNSDDDLDEVLGWLSSRRIVTTRYAWPWPKTQEAGLSHCAVAARSSCTWTLFTDVDEFLYTPRFLPPGTSKETPLQQLISGTQAINQKAGQISMNCRDFGPSGLASHPTDGVTQGYTCRARYEQRHKSIVRLDVVDHDLQNVVHHFNLQPKYITIRASGSVAVINHYKFQAWSEFRRKFRRRVSAYVVDWTEHKNMGSKDRTPGLGSKDIKPANWETSFCDVVDTSLRNYTRGVFATTSLSNGVPLLAWQL